MKILHRSIGSTANRMTLTTNFGGVWKKMVNDYDSFRSHHHQLLRFPCMSPFLPTLTPLKHHCHSHPPQIAAFQSCTTAPKLPRSSAFKKLSKLPSLASKGLEHSLLRHQLHLRLLTHHLGVPTQQVLLML